MKAHVAALLALSVSGCTVFETARPLATPKIQVRTTSFDRSIECVRDLLAQSNKKGPVSVERVVDQTTAQLYHGVGQKYARDLAESVLFRLGQPVLWAADDGRISNTNGVKQLGQIRGGIAALDLTTDGRKTRQDFSWSPGKGRGALDFDGFNTNDVSSGTGTIILTMWLFHYDTVKPVRQIGAVRVTFNFARQERTTGFSGAMTFYGLRAGYQQSTVHVDGIHEVILQAHEVAVALLIAEVHRIDPKPCFGW